MDISLPTSTEEPWCLSPGGLEIWYNKNIQCGTDAFARDCGSAIDRVVRHVHENRAADILDFDIDQVVKGGSIGKGTNVRYLSDVVLVAFVNEPYLQPIAGIGVDEYRRTLSRIISNLTSTLRGAPNVATIQSNDYSVNFKIRVGSRWIDVDLVPTTSNLPFYLSYDVMFRAMLEVERGILPFYNASLVQHRVQFVMEQPGHVKELIRLVKIWARRFLPNCDQKSYPLELITIYRWEKAGKPGRRMCKAQGLRSVLEVLTNLEQLCASWQYLHSDRGLEEAVIRRFRMNRPIVLDPANPTNNVCHYMQGDSMKGAWLWPCYKQLFNWKR